ncbi:MAG: D-alanine--D-alanine ligase [Firmicutes bacterium]|nr:D-alanine--D-alanine ligase [Bacillota bacterium]
MKINLAVLFGGKSVEHEISVISALQAIRNLNAEKYEIYPIYITKKNEFYYGDELKDINEFRNIPELLGKCERVNFVTEGSRTYIAPYAQKMFGKKLIAPIDVAFPIVHGTNVEDGALQGFLKTFNLPFVGCDVLPSAICMDKYVAKVLLRECGIPVLDGLRFTQSDYSDLGSIVSRVEEKFGYPVIVKPVNLGSSVGISKAENTAELEAALSDAYTYADKVLVEPAVVNLKEINCSVIGDSEYAEASECEEPVASDKILSYSDKYLDNSKQGGGSKGMASLKRKIPADIPADVKEKIQKCAVDAFKYLDCNGVVRIDFLMDSKTNEFWLNEINAIPGSLSFYLWEPVGVKYTELLDKMIALALKRQRQVEDITFSFDTNILSSATGFGAKGAKGSKM